MREGWISNTLGNCIKLKSGDSLTAKNMISGDYPVFGGNGIAGYHNNYNLSGKNVVIGRVGALCGNARFVNQKIWLTDNAFYISDFKYEFDLVFLNYLLNHLNLRSYARQAAQPVISNSSLKSVILTFPKSISEQKQIVSILDKAFAAIDQAKANIEKNMANAKELFQSKIDLVFTKKGNDWNEKKLGEISSIEYGYTDKSTPNGDYRYVRITDIDTNGKLISEDKKYIKYSVEDKKYILKDKDILMARTGATFAKVLLYNDFEPSIFASYLIRINFDEKIENKLYWFFSKSRYYWQQANNLSSGSAQPHFNGAALKQVVFSYPKSIKEQKYLINKFEGFLLESHKIETIYNKKLALLEELKKSILQKAFAGELTKELVESNV